MKEEKLGLLLIFSPILSNEDTETIIHLHSFEENFRDLRISFPDYSQVNTRNKRVLKLIIFIFNFIKKLFEEA